MNKKYEELVELCSNLYRDRHGDIKKSCMPWGFCVGPGWFDLIKELSIKLEELIVKYKKDISKEDYPRAIQVKEKFGTLRFYMTTETEEMSKLIEEAEEKSENICEKCGKPGHLINDRGWYKVRCKQCNIKKKDENSA